MPGDVRNVPHGVNAYRQAVGVVGTVTATTTPTPAATSVVTRVAVNVANVTLKAANANRLGLTIFNSSSQFLFLKLGATADITGGAESYTIRIAANGYYEVPFAYVGIVDGIWNGADATGEALITELTA